MNKYMSVIGRAEPITMIIAGTEYTQTPAKVDSGAYSSSIWATDIAVKGDELQFVLFGKGHPSYTGEVITTKKFEEVTVENSFGDNQKRFGVTMQVRFCGKKFNTFFTLSDRSSKIYTVLVGRRLIKNRFMVNVAIGHPIADEATEENEGYQKIKSFARR